MLVTLLLAPVPYALLIAFTGQKYDRYALPVVPFLALIAGVGVAVATDRWAQRFGGPGLGLAILAGLYLAGTEWGWREPWIDVALGGVVLVGAVWGRMTGARLARLQREGGAVPLTDPVLWRSLTTRAGLLVGIVFLMTVKPGWAVSLVGLGIGLAAGVLAGRPPSPRRSVA